MTNEEAHAVLTELRHIYSVALAERGHNIDGFTDLMNGLAAYFTLKLEGEFEELDEAVDTMCRIVYAGVVEKLNQDKKDC